MIIIGIIARDCIAFSDGITVTLICNTFFLGKNVQKMRNFPNFKDPLLRHFYFWFLIYLLFLIEI